MTWTETGNHGLHAERDILRVSELNRAVQNLLSDHFPLLWVEGELSNLTRAVSGHFYFTLKDAAAQVRCAMFSSRNRLLDFAPENGQQVLVRARVGLYQARGDFQLVIEDMEPCGEGLLRLQFERIKFRLQEEGLFDSEHKQPLPEYPTTIGIITSESAAALQDVLHVIERRYPCVDLCIYPTQVQGEPAPQSLCQALKVAERHDACDVLLLVRGGGSLEDLWGFNDEHVARAIHACPIPIITGIGHETDFTIADFVADKRAPTPSAAAELATPDQQELLAHLNRLEKRLEQNIIQHLQDDMQYLDRLGRRLFRQHPETRLSDCKKRLPRLLERLQRIQQQKQDAYREHLEALIRLLDRPVLLLGLSQKKRQLQYHVQRLEQEMHLRLQQAQHAMQLKAQGLHQLSPLSTLNRGYALVNTPDGTLIRKIGQVAENQRLKVRLSDGTFDCQVTHKPTQTAS